MDRDKKQFVLNQSWTVRTKPTMRQKCLHVAVEAGANQSGQIEWQYRDMNALQASAAAEAPSPRPQAIAQQMAQGLNVKLSGLIYASNQAPASPVQRLEQTHHLADHRPMAKAVAPLRH